MFLALRAAEHIEAGRSQSVVVRRRVGGGTVVENNRGLFVAVGVLAVALGLGPVQGVRLDVQSSSALSSEDSRAAERLLQRAKEALGGAAKLAAIDRLQIAAVEGVSGDSESARRRSLKLWLPDRFQSHYEGVVTHTMNGDRVTFDREISPDVQRTAEQSLPPMFRRFSLAFLLRAPGLSAPHLRGEVTIGDLKGSVVEFTAPDGRVLKLLLAPTTAQPLALIFSVRAIGSTAAVPDQIWKLEDYRTVDGVRFPFKLTVARPENPIVTEVQHIEVNPPFTSADFPR